MKKKKPPVILELKKKPWDFFFIPSKSCLVLVGVEKQAVAEYAKIRGQRFFLKLTFGFSPAMTKGDLKV